MSRTFSFHEAVQALNQHPDATIKRQAEEWLETFQESAQAWTMCDSLLHDPTSTQEVKFFCSQTLKRKVQRDFSDLPAEAALHLRDSLLTLLLKHQEGPVRTQLALAVASLAAHVPANDWDGIGALRWLAMRLTRSEDKAAALSCLLELLVVFPQEAGSFRPAVHPNRRRAFTKEMIQESPSAIDMIATCVQHMPAEMRHVRERALDAYSAWVRLSQGSAGTGDVATVSSAVDASKLSTHPLTILALDSLNLHDTDPDIFYHAVDAVCELVRSTVGSEHLVDSHTQSVIPEASSALAHLIVSRVLELRQALSDASASPGDTDEVAKSISRLLVEIGEAYAPVIAAGSPDAIAIAESLLRVTAYPDDDIASISFNFWHQLAHLLTQRYDRKSAHASSPQSDAECVRRNELFRPAYVQLIHNVMVFLGMHVTLAFGRLRYPEDFLHFTREDRREFKEARYAIADTLTSAAAVVGPAQTLHIISSPLRESSNFLVSGTPDCSLTPGLDWRALEAALYAIRSISKETPPPGDEYLISILLLLADLPNHPQLLYTATLTASAYSEWISASHIHNKRSSLLLQRLLDLLHRALVHDDPDTRSASALAFKHICDANANEMTNFLEPLTQLHTAVMNLNVQNANFRQCSANVSSSAKSGVPLISTAHADDILKITEGLCYVISALPPERASSVLSFMLVPISDALRHLFPVEQPLEKHAFDMSVVVVNFDRLATVVRYVSHPELVAIAFRELWPFVSSALEYCNGVDERSTEHICRCIKYAIRTSRHRLSDLVAPAASLYKKMFVQRQLASIIFAISELVRSFGNDPACFHMLCSSVETVVLGMSDKFLKLSDFDAAPDVVDDAFLLAKVCLVHCPASTVNLRLLPTILDMAVIGIHIQHREACCSILVFLRDLMDLNDRELLKVLENVLSQRGSAIVRSLLAGALGSLPTTRLRDITEVFFAMLSRVETIPVVSWFHEALISLPDIAASPADKLPFLEALDRCRRKAGHRRQLEDSLGDLSELCRRTKRIREAVGFALKGPFCC